MLSLGMGSRPIRPASGPRTTLRPPRTLAFRATRTTILLSLLALTVASLGGCSYVNARFTARNLSDRILDQTSESRRRERADRLAIGPSAMAPGSARMLRRGP